MTKKLFRPWSTSSNEILDYLSRWEIFDFLYFLFSIYFLLFPECFFYSFAFLVHSRALFVFNLLFAISRVPDNEELESYKPLQPKVKVGTKEQSKR